MNSIQQKTSGFLKPSAHFAQRCQSVLMGADVMVPDDRDAEPVLARIFGEA